MEKRDHNNEEIENGGQGFGSRLKVGSVVDPLAKLKTEAQKSKINAIWEQLNSGGPSPVPPKVVRTGHLDTPKKSKDTKPSKKEIPSFLINLGLVKPKSRQSSISETLPPVEAPPELSHSEQNENREGTAEANIASEESAIIGSLGESSLAEVAGNALAAAKLALSSNFSNEVGKIKVTEEMEFAGQKVQVTKILDPNSKEGLALKRKAEMKASATQGLDSLLSQIEKKKKINILDKSRKDWDQYKEEVGVVEELEVFKKSGDTFTEKVAFLDRAEVREYEKERDERLAAQSRRKVG